MATATISKSGDVYTVSGGSSADPITLKDIQAATNSDMDVLNRNACQTSSKKAFQYVFNSSSYVDLSGARMFLRNNSNGQRIYFKFDGHIKIGSSTDALHCFELHYGDKDCGGYTNTRFPLFGTTVNAYVDCPNVNNRIKLMSHLDGPGSSSSGEPGSKNGIWLENNRSGNKIRVSILGASYTYGSSYSLPNSTGFKPNGTSIVNWRIGGNVTVRDIEFRDGYVDWRPAGTWDAPTRGIFVSETWMKFLGSKAFTFATPLIFGNEDDSFEVVVGNSGQTGSYILHGLFSTGSEGRIVYNNFKGLTWSTQMALYSAGDKIRVENHLQLDYTLIDSLAQPVDGAVITLYKKNPVYNSTNNDVGYTGSEVSFDTTTGSTGKGNIGQDDGDLDHAIAVEAFCRYGTGGNVDTDYANKDHARADYANYTSLYYTIIKWGKKPIIKTSYTAKLAGQTGEGKQSLGVIQLETDTDLTAATEGAVASTITDAESFYDNMYKYALNNKQDIFADRIGDKIESSNSIVFDNSAGSIMDLTGTVITAKANSFSSDVSSTSGTITFKTAFDLTDVTLTGDVHFNLGVNSTLDFSNVTVTGNIYNDDTAHTLKINATNGSSLTAGDAGTGNGETYIAHPVTVKVIVKDAGTGSFIQNARVAMHAMSGGTLPYRASVTITRSSSTATVAHTAHGLVTGDFVIIEGADDLAYDGQHEITVTGVNSYTYSVVGTPVTPAVGTITSTARIMNELTDTNGEASVSFNYDGDQPIGGNVRKATP